MEKGIGVRAFRDGLTRHLASVRRGARFVITDRGTPIAVLAPYGEGEQAKPSARLPAVLSSGHVNPAARPFLPDPPLVRGRGKPASAILSEMASSLAIPSISPRRPSRKSGRPTTTSWSTRRR